MGCGRAVAETAVRRHCRRPRRRAQDERGSGSGEARRGRHRGVYRSGRAGARWPMRWAGKLPRNSTIWPRIGDRVRLAAVTGLCSRPLLGCPFIVTTGHEWSPGLSQNQASGGLIGEGLGFPGRKGVDVGRIFGATGVVGNMRRVIRAFAVAACAVVLVGCATVSRIPFTPQEQSTAVDFGIPGRGYGLMIQASRRNDPSRPAASPSSNRLRWRCPAARRWCVRRRSAGGMVHARTRPVQFTVVMEHSAGALIAPFAFMGLGLRRHAQECVRQRRDGEPAAQSDGLAGLLRHGAVQDSAAAEIRSPGMSTAALLEAIAHEYRTGRRLYVVTTNLDAQRTAIWDMGKDRLREGDPRALELFRNVLTAIREHSRA